MPPAALLAFNSANAPQTPIGIPERVTFRNEVYNSRFSFLLEINYGVRRNVIRMRFWLRMFFFMTPDTNFHIKTAETTTLRSKI